MLDLCPAVLVELALARREDPGEHRRAGGEDRGANRTVASGQGFIVEDPASRDQIHWGRVNWPFPREQFEAL